MVPPLVADSRYLGIGRSAQAVLQGSYTPPAHTDDYAKQFTTQLTMPANIHTSGEHPMILTIDQYRNYWKKVKEQTSCFPGPLSFSTQKAGAQDEVVSTFECIMSRILLFGGFTPSRWKECINVMLLKKAGHTHFDALWTIVLFHPDCNYAMKRVGCRMRNNAKVHQSQAAEQYGSRKKHCSIDLATNKSLCHDLNRQMKTKHQEQFVPMM
jgi:hypothetical protein